MVDMNKLKMVFLGFLGGMFLILGLYYRIYEPAKSTPYEYMGIGTWAAGVMFNRLFPRYKEITYMIIGLLVLHAGVLLLLKDNYSNPKLLGLLVFTAGIVVVLSSGFSDYMKRRKIKK
ncbi:membrane hypothetical protein [Candidatus Methanoperedens nitroreducens]|uniref:Uncharacterized protein n=2 Tax=Candidatus Methanoperedens nitratireducens TaxID=1392998 RepID=A0A284VJR3_9EURY|nr:membrane hypothetical protein [Candidatus Methanoperedens nitroreducens]